MSFDSELLKQADAAMLLQRNNALLLERLTLYAVPRFFFRECVFRRDLGADSGMTWARIPE